jgi:hypothetical protein
VPYIINLIFFVFINKMLKWLVVKTLMFFDEVLGSIFDGSCFNVFCTNEIYKHIHHGEYTNMYIMP